MTDQPSPTTQPLTTPSPASPPSPSPAPLDHDAMLRGIDDMIYSVVRRRFRTILLCDDDIEEIVQTCRIHVWTRTIPRFDPAKGVKFSTYAHQAISWITETAVRKIMRRRSSPSCALSLDTVLRFDDECDTMHVTAPDASCDRRVEQIAEDVLQRPEAYMTPSQADVFRALVDKPVNQTMAGLSHQCGYTRPTSLSTIIQRVRERIDRIDIDEWEPSRERPTPAATRRLTDRCRPVQQLHARTYEVMGDFPSISEAARAARVRRAAIYQAIRHGTVCGEYRWAYADQGVSAGAGNRDE